MGVEEITDTNLELSMRKYDSIDYSYKTGDKQSADAIRIISGVLGFEPDKVGLEYELNLYAGGTGIDDRLAFCAALADGKMKAAIKGLQLITPEEAINDPAWGEDFAWLLGDETVSATAQDLSIRFINQNRKQFQCVCSEHCTVLFGRESNVNTWSAVWISNGALNYLSFDQG